MKRNGKIAAALLMGVLILGLTGCGGVQREADGAAADMEAAKYKDFDLYSYATSDQKEAQKPGAVFDTAAGEAVGQMNSGSGSVYRNSEVKLIRRANLTVQTTEFEAAQGALDALVIEMGGYYENTELRSGSYYNQNSNRSGSYTIRIPAENYDKFMSQVNGIGYLARINESSEDVGVIYHDIETRLKTQRTKQERLLELLEKAQSMEDIIALESALSDVEYQIEQYSSDLNRYDGLVGFATIYLTMDEMVKIVDEPGERASLLTRMKAGVISSANGLVDGVQDALIWVAYNLIGLAVLIAAATCGVVFARRYIKRRAEKNRQKEEEGAEE